MTACRCHQAKAEYLCLVCKDNGENGYLCGGCYNELTKIEKLDVIRI